MNTAEQCHALATKLYYAPRPEGKGSESWDKWDDAREIEKITHEILTIADQSYCDGVKDVLNCLP